MDHSLAQKLDDLLSGQNEKHCTEKCWEVLSCGKQEHCPAYPDRGRICWAVAGTMCDNQVSGAFAQKRVTCMSCDFFKKVRSEEGEDFVF